MTPPDKNLNQHHMIQREGKSADPLLVGEVLPGVLGAMRARQLAEQDRRPRIDPDTARKVIEEAEAVLASPFATEGQRDDAARRIENAKGSQALSVDGSAG